ncbi:hypothetical protein SMSP2_00125 [Limihaloglobus sulfuriphilus]|uniref:YD repeat (Two copies) n=1 Tax=Limihaloglobus sulfuriphilus TaxID=1851148 RepID=A0A1Q2MAT0_9BACT|nr:hypothetical protein [Limihaloglobus sulfuriphilus]AQQ69791.1 hypothetical protein SMSP2_00125 [Limihaloglobus sulfuriphilus]
MKTSIKSQIAFLIFIAFVMSWSQSFSASVPPESLAGVSLFNSPDGTGESLRWNIYGSLWDPAVGDSFYYTSGYSTPQAVSQMQCILTGGLNQYAVETITRTSVSTDTSETAASAQYDSQGRIIQIEQVNKDPDQPSDFFTFQYDSLGRLTEVQMMAGGPMGAVMGGISSSNYCDDCPRQQRKVPRNIKYTNYSDPNKDVEVSAEYDTNNRLVSIRYCLREHDHIGQFSFGYNEQGRLVMISNGLDNDCDGYYENPLLSAYLDYDADGRITMIDDYVSDSNILQWIRRSISDNDDEEEIRIRSIFGDSDQSIFTTTISDGAGTDTYSENAEVTVPDAGGSVNIRNWNWWGLAVPPSLVSADVNWSPPQQSADSSGISNRVILPILSPGGELAATVDLQEISICSYKASERKKGLVLDRNGTARDELHFYDYTPDGNIAAMLTMDEYGNAIIGIGGPNAELMRYNFFEAWPSKWKGFSLDSQEPPSEPLKGDAWDQRNDPARFGFFDGWPDSWGVQPYIPIYSQTGDGTLYLAGTVTSGGAYCYFQYGEKGLLEAIVRMNSVDNNACLEEIEGDANGDCRVDFADIAVMAQNWLQCNLEYQHLCR